MVADPLKQYKDDFFLLLEAGFMAVNAADEDSATKLFKAAQILRPENSFPKIGFSYMHLCKLELKRATLLLQEVLEKEPENEIAKSLWGICLSLTPTESAKGEKALTELSLSSHDSGIKKFADSTLSFIDRFIKKSPSPVQPQQSHHKGR